MMTNATIENLKNLRLHGMTKALEEAISLGSVSKIDPLELIGMMADRELCDRESRRMERRLKSAKLRLPAQIEDIDWKVGRGLDRSVIANLCTSEWVKRKQNVIFLGPAGTGKTCLHVPWLTRPFEMDLLQNLSAIHGYSRKLTLLVLMGA